MVKHSPYGGLQHIGEDNSCQQSDECRETYAADGRMLGQKHAADGDNEDDGREQHGGLMTTENRPLSVCLIVSAFTMNRSGKPRLS